MSRFLFKDGRLAMYAGRMVTRVDGASCSCCSEDGTGGPCEACGALDPYAALICPSQQGMLATWADIALADTFETSTDEYSIDWVGGSTLSGSGCLVAVSTCGRVYYSGTPVKVGMVQGGGDPVPYPVEFRLGLWFYCTAGEAGESGPPIIGAYVTGVYPGPDGDVRITLFSSRYDTGPGTGNTYVEWPRTCATSGYVLTNAMTGVGDRAFGDDYAAGGGGTVTTGGPCIVTHCRDGCTLSAVSLTIDDPLAGPFDGVDVVATHAGLCNYAFDDGRYHGTITPQVVVGTEGLLWWRHRLLIEDRDTPGAGTLEILKICTGSAEPVLGTYRPPRFDPFETIDTEITAEVAA